MLPQVLDGRSLLTVVVRFVGFIHSYSFCRSSYLSDANCSVVDPRSLSLKSQHDLETPSLIDVSEYQCYQPDTRGDVAVDIHDSPETVHSRTESVSDASQYDADEGSVPTQYSSTPPSFSTPSLGYEDETSASMALSAPTAPQPLVQSHACNSVSAQQQISSQSVFDPRSTKHFRCPYCPRTFSKSDKLEYLTLFSLKSEIQC